MHPSVAPLVIILDLNTDLLLNCLDGISEVESERRLPGGGNSLAFLAAHLTDSRYFLAARLGHPVENPIAKYLEGARTIDEIREWPSVDELRAAWLDVSTHLQKVLSTLTEADLARPNAHRFPVADSSRLGLIAFLVQHDSYHLGQAAFLRRQLGKPAMQYTRSSPPGSATGPKPEVSGRSPRLIRPRGSCAILPIT